jgi:hypothetical protein
MSALILAPNEKDPVKVAAAVNQLAQGRSNATGTVTLTTSATSTTVTAGNCATSSVVLLMPKTANAAGAIGTTYVSAVANKSFTLTHANNAQTDRTFGWIALG